MDEMDVLRPKLASLAKPYFFGKKYTAFLTF